MFIVVLYLFVRVAQLKSEKREDELKNESSMNQEKMKVFCHQFVAQLIFRPQKRDKQVFFSKHVN